MQTLELILVLVSTIYILFYRRINISIDKKYIIGGLVFILVLHLIINGYRMQMIPAYLIWAISLFTALWSSEKSSSTFIRVIKYFGLAILLALAIIFPSVFPVFELPQPTGAYTVGTNDIMLTLDREETITTEKDDKRSIMIKAWYPSNESGKEEDVYIDRGGRNGFAQKYGLPGSFFNYLDNIETHVYRDVKIADETFPVLIFSHGYNSKANGYYALLSELASQGYVIFAINHTYESTGTTFSDGQEVYFNYSYASEIESDTWEIVEPAIQAFQEGLSFEERHPAVREALKTYFVKDMVDRWALDIKDVVSELNEWNNEGFYAGKLDLSNVGVFGHSRGGGAAGHALLIDNRIKAGANIDGVQWGPIVDTAFQQPFLFISADWPEEHEDLNSHAYVNKSNSYFYEGLIHQSAHSNFMDIPYMIPVNALSQAGEIEPGMAIEITNVMVASFFDKHLKNKAVDLSLLDSEYELLDFQVFPGDSVPSKLVAKE